MVTNLYELPVILLVELDLMLYNQIAVRNDFFNTFKYINMCLFSISWLVVQFRLLFFHF